MSRAYESWIFSEEEHLGSEVRVASLSSNRKPIYAVAVREVFDRKIDSKMLRFFLSGDDILNMSNVWVCVPKTSKVPIHTLFYGESSGPKYNAESRLLQNCNPLTIGQRCADWFLMRSFHLTGTVGSTIGSLDDNITNERLNDILGTLLSSWYNRFPSTKPMKIGTKNEDSTMMALRQESFVEDLFEVGLLQHGFMKYVAVSPDGVVLLRIRNTLHYACVEIKTRVAEETQVQALAAVMSYGRVVYCKYNDFRFKSCVPSDHRGQLLHQALVTGLFYSVYVVALANEENCSRIAQIVVCEIEMSHINVHYDNLLAWGSRLLGWLHFSNPIDRGYLIDADFPAWVDKKQRDVFKSRSYLWYAYYKKIQDEEQFKPSRPLKLFKSSYQFLYNKGKGGLDKSTEQEGIIRAKTKTCFETKYIIRLINAIVINSWRVSQGMALRETLVNENGNLSIIQIRRKMYQMPLADYTARIAEQLLQKLAIEKVSILPSPTQPTNNDQSIVHETEAEISASIGALELAGKWPVVRYKIRAFSEGPLNKLRLFRSGNICHEVHSFAKKNGRKCRSICVLCFVKGQVRRDSCFYCSVCKVALCITPFQNGSTDNTCFKKWHTAKDLKREHSRRQQLLLRSKS